MSTEQRRLLVFAGSYAEASDNGIYVFECDEQTGQLTEVACCSGMRNPTFVNIDADRGMLYAIGEGTNDSGKKVGEAAAFRIHAADGALELLNRRLTVDNTTCHIQRDQDSKYLTVTSYHGGMVGMLAIQSDGGVGELLDVQQHEGRSVNPEVQDRPRPHSSFYSPDGRFLLVQDLGMDQIITYRLDSESGKLIRQSAASCPPGAGPRHLTFHPNGAFAYVINELASTISTFAYDQVKGELTLLETVSTLPDDYEGENGCAEIAIASDGRFLYGSNRGHDSIVVFQVDSDFGKLTIAQHISVEGGHPRHFALSPKGNLLFAANRDSDNIVTFRVDASDGTLSKAGHQVTVSKPVCVVPAYFNK